MIKRYMVPFFFILTMMNKVAGQVIQQVADINPAGSAYPWQLTLCNNKLFFVATNQDNLRSLYVTEGSAATTQQLITPRQISLSLYPVAYKSKLFFSYDERYKRSGTLG